MVADCKSAKNCRIILAGMFREDVGGDWFWYYGHGSWGWAPIHHNKLRVIFGHGFSSLGALALGDFAHVLPFILLCCPLKCKCLTGSPPKKRAAGIAAPHLHYI